MIVQCPQLIDMTEVDDICRELLQGFQSVDPGLLEVITCRK